MFTIQRLFLLPGTLVALIAMTSMCFAQCSSCNSNSQWPSRVGGRCAGDCGGGCNGLAGGGRAANVRGHFQDRYDKFRAEFELVTARNCAWPLPFNCQDREAYYTIWNAQYNTGLTVAHTLTGEYFDPQTNELNTAGQAKVAWIMQNSPTRERVIYVYEDQTAPTIDQRIQNINRVVNKWYAHMGQFNVAKTQIRPNGIPAVYQEYISQSYFDSQPVPTIPVSRNSSITSSVNN